jgi:hypothetical protein
MVLDRPGLDSAVLSSRDNGVIVQPGDNIDSSTVSVLNLDTLRRILNAPHEDVGIQSTTDQVERIRRPSQRVNLSSVEYPSLNLDLY